MSVKQDRLNAVEKDFVMQAKTAFGDNLRSIILYGSILTENYNPLSSDINLLIILKQADPERIIVLGKYAAKILQSSKITPTILSYNEFISSADIFPMEYFDIKELHKTIYGDDVFKDLEISKANLRLQTEDRLRGCINSLRQVLLLSESNPKYIANGVRHTHGLYNAIFRSILRLVGEEKIAYTYVENLKAASEYIDFNPQPFKDICRIAKDTPIESVVVELVLALVNIVDFVDKLNIK
ncbi:MAG: hypothetical protein J6T61_02330 [Spirochaetia bacterium]|nr:hypothetical protein [Spirochaetia bacterium]